MPGYQRPPKYCLHKGSGQAYVTLNGKPRYLGKHGSAQSKARYKELIDDWSLRRDALKVVELTVGELVLLYWEFAKGHYRKHGKPTSEIGCIKTILRYLATYRATRVLDFGPKKLAAIRQSMIVDGHCRKSINKHLGRVRRVFSWAVAEEYCTPAVLMALKEVKGLQRGRTDAVEMAPVTPVSPDRVDAVRPYVTAPVWAMIQVQLFTGMRPGEVLVMRRKNLNMNGDV